MKPEAFVDYPMPADEAGRYWRAAVVVPGGQGTVWAIRPSDHPDMFVLPGGHIDQGEHPEMAARREAIEEAGLTVEIQDHLGVLETPKSLTHVFLATTAMGPIGAQTPDEVAGKAVRVPIAALVITDQQHAFKGLQRHERAQHAALAKMSEREYVRHPKGSAQGGEFAETPGGSTRGSTLGPDDDWQSNGYPTRSKDAVIAKHGDMVTEIGKVATGMTSVDKTSFLGLEVTSLAPARDQGAFESAEPIRTQMTKQETGKLADLIARKFFQSRKGVGEWGFHYLDTKQSNFPIDAVVGNEALEIKAGLVDNTPGAQQWRITKGEAGEVKKQIERHMSREKLAVYNRDVKKYLMLRKSQATRAVAKALGKPLRPATIAMIINPDTRTVRIYKFEGHHERIGWKSKMARDGYVGTFRYGTHVFRESDVVFEPLEPTDLRRLYEAIWREELHPRDGTGKFSDGGGVAATSPSVDESQDLETALERTLHGAEHARWKAEADAIDRHFKLQAETVNAVGDTTEWGSEDSFFTTYKSGTFDDIAAAAIQKGLAMRQKAVLPFKLDDTGPDSIFTLDLPQERFTSPKVLQRLAKTLGDHDIEFRTFIPLDGGGTRIAIVSLSAFGAIESDYQKVDRLSDALGVTAKQQTGHGEIIGADTREDAAVVYRERLSRHRLAPAMLSESERSRIVNVTQEMLQKGIAGYALIGGRMPGAKTGKLSAVAPAREAEWDETLHPRDDRGRFVSVPVDHDLGNRLEHVKAAGGSQGAQWMRDPETGDRYVIKTYRGNADRVATEVLSAAVYRKLGIPVPEVTRSTREGQPAAISKEITGAAPHETITDSAALRKGFMADVLTANWDTVGLEFDNVIWKDDTPYRVDFGGSFTFRAMGDPKAYDTAPTEHETFLTKNPNTKRAFGRIAPADLKAQAVAIANALDDQWIDDAVEKAGFASDSIRNQVRSGLKRRRDWMRDYAGLAKRTRAREAEAAVADPEFEAKHPRGEGGKFVDKGTGGGEGAPAEDKKPKIVWPGGIDDSGADTFTTATGVAWVSKGDWIEITQANADNAIGQAVGLGTTKDGEQYVAVEKVGGEIQVVHANAVWGKAPPPGDAPAKEFAEPKKYTKHDLFVGDDVAAKVGAGEITGTIDYLTDTEVGVLHGDKLTAVPISDITSVGSAALHGKVDWPPYFNPAGKLSMDDAGGGKGTFEVGDRIEADVPGSGHFVKGEIVGIGKHYKDGYDVAALKVDDTGIFQGKTIFVKADQIAGKLAPKVENKNAYGGTIANSMGDKWPDDVKQASYDPEVYERQGVPFTLNEEVMYAGVKFNIQDFGLRDSGAPILALRNMTDTETVFAPIYDVTKAAGETPPEKFQPATAVKWEDADPTAKAHGWIDPKTGEYTEGVNDSDAQIRAKYTSGHILINRAPKHDATGAAIMFHPGAVNVDLVRNLIDKHITSDQFANLRLYSVTYNDEGSKVDLIAESVDVDKKLDNLKINPPPAPPPPMPKQGTLTSLLDWANKAGYVGKDIPAKFNLAQGTFATYGSATVLVTAALQGPDKDWKVIVKDNNSTKFFLTDPGALGSTMPKYEPEPDDEPDEDEEEEPYVPDSWDGLTSEQQEQTKEKWIDDNKQEYIDSEIQSYIENSVPENVDQNMNDDDSMKTDMLRAILMRDNADVHVDLNDYETEVEGHEGFPTGLIDEKDRDRLVQAITHMTVSKAKNSWGKQDVLAVSDDDAATIPFSGGPDPRQLTIEGMTQEEVVKQYRISQWHKIKDAVASAYKDNWDKERDKRIETESESVDESYVSDSVEEYMDSHWDEMSDSDKFGKAEAYNVFEKSESKPGQVHFGGRTSLSSREEPRVPVSDIPPPSFDRDEALAQTGQQATTHKSLMEKVGESLGNDDEGEANFLAKLARRGITIKNDWDSWPDHPLALATRAAAGAVFGGMVFTSRDDFKERRDHGEEGLRDADDAMDHAHGRVTSSHGDLSEDEFDRSFEAYVKAQYEMTQKYAADDLDDTITLYRGVGTHEVGDAPTLKLGQMVKFKPSSLASYSTSREDGDNFGKITVKITVPRHAIFSYHRTGPGTKSENEYLVIGDDYEFTGAVVRNSKLREADVPKKKDDDTDLNTPIDLGSIDTADNMNWLAEVRREKKAKFEAALAKLRAKKKAKTIAQRTREAAAPADDPEFEDKHPRGEGGRFVDKGTGGGEDSAEAAAERVAARRAERVAARREEGFGGTIRNSMGDHWPADVRQSNINSFQVQPSGGAPAITFTLNDVVTVQGHGDEHFNVQDFGKREGVGTTWVALRNTADTETVFAPVYSLRPFTPPPAPEEQWRRDLPETLSPLDRESVVVGDTYFHVGNRIDSERTAVENSEILGFAQARDGSRVMVVQGASGVQRYVVDTDATPHVAPAPPPEVPQWRRELPPSLSALDRNSLGNDQGYFNVGNRIDSTSFHVENAEILGFAKARDGSEFAVVQERGVEGARYVTMSSVTPYVAPEPVTDEDEDEDEDEEEEQEYVPESWEELSNDQQEEAFDEWRRANYGEWVRQEEDYQREEYVPGEVDREMRDDDTYKQETLFAILNGNEGDVHVSLEGVYEFDDGLRDAIDQLTISTEDDLDLDDDDAASLPFAGGPDPAQATIEGVTHEELVRQYRIAKWNEIKDEVAAAYKKNWDKERDKRIDDYEIDVSDSVNDNMRESWDNMSDRDRFSEAQRYLDALGGETTRGSRYRSTYTPTPAPEPLPEKGEPIAIDLKTKKGFAPTDESEMEKVEDLEGTNLVKREGNAWMTTKSGERVRALLTRYKAPVSIEDIVDAYTPRHPEIDLETTLEVTVDGNDDLVVRGNIVESESGKSVGDFTRHINLSEGYVKHDSFFLRKDFQGAEGGPDLKLGGLFSVTTDKFYRALGLKKVKLDAVSNSGDKVTGHQIWSHQGYDWTDEYQAGKIRKAFTRAIEKRYGKDSPEYTRAKEMQTKDAAAFDYNRFVDEKGEKVGFKLMHLGKLATESGLDVPSMAAMARSLKEDSPTNKVWTQYSDGVVKKMQEKERKASGGKS